MFNDKKKGNKKKKTFKKCCNKSKLPLHRNTNRMHNEQMRMQTKDAWEEKEKFSDLFLGFHRQDS